MPDETDALANQGAAHWRDALLAIEIAALGGDTIGGIWLKARSGAARDAFLERLRARWPADRPWVRLPATATPNALRGGIDLSASAAAGRLIGQRGLLAAADGGVLMIPMAERLEPAAAAIIAEAMDRGSYASPYSTAGAAQGRAPARFAVIALDESAEPEEALPTALADRLGLHLDLDPVGWRETTATVATADIPETADTLDWRRCTLDEPLLRLLAGAADSAGHRSLHVLRQLAIVARLHAVLMRRDSAVAEDVLAALRLCLGLRPDPQPDSPQASQEELVQPEPPAPPEQQQDAQPETMPDPSEDDSVTDRTSQPDIDPPAEWLTDAEAGSIDGLPAFGAPERAAAARSRAGKAGAMQKNARRGRPFATSPSPPYPDARPDLIATLRTAAPWQKLRAQQLQTQRSASPEAAPRLLIRKEDFRYQRLRHKAPSTAIFLVDASGSTSLERLGETKGAIEQLLARCYVRRDEVALVAFRGTAASIILPPTRSLTLAKRTLSGLPGGGPTPLVSGLDTGFGLALSVRRQGGTPVLVLLTDGSGNIARDGSANRALAREQLGQAAALYRGHRLKTICIDIARRPREQVAALAADLGADHHVLRHANAAALSDVVYASMTTASASEARL
ncbi:MAG: VWA domain-containing protein [Oceanibaculum nanhaiense]|uniref:VWA domain-containing protein n=1 Tax=Oceanibaculum nanhaiense TaxID=1909734 RepID=UPI0025A42EFB|nr:VWA domain-containing protein [Oceanibaculum nanhaiense]MDM7947336.1 VWA domain-containing protein [Oceanibaculum nanhaiense]